MYRNFIKRGVYFIQGGCILLTILLSMVAIPARSQTTEALVTLEVEHETLQVILKKIEKQASVSFSYNEEIISQSPLLTVRFRNTPIEKVLQELSRLSSLRFRNLGSTILIEKAISDRAKPGKGARSVHGRALDGNTNEALPGVSVMISGSVTGTMTDVAGDYTLALPDEGDAQLVFSFIGYKSQQQVVGDRSDVSVALEPDARMLEDVVVIGYGTQFKSHVTGAIAQIKASDFEHVPVTSIEQAMAGQLPGVQVTQASGSPGSNLSIQVRGVGTITAGSQPLVVIDGFPTSGNNSSLLNPGDVASVEVLKDAAASAIYGSRGSNGVILITTKRGSEGVPVLKFHTYHGVQRVSKTIDLLDAYQNATLTAAARNNTWVNSDPAHHAASDPNTIRTGAGKIPSFMLPYLEGQTGLANTDWQDAIFRDAAIHNYDLSLSHGSDNMKYFVSANYLDQEGIIIHSGFKRYSLRANLENKLSRKVSLGFNLAPSFARYDQVSEDTYKKDGIVLSALMALPNFPVYNSDGSLAISQHIKEGANSTVWVENPVALATLIDDRYESARFLGGTYVTVEPLPALILKSYAGADYGSSRQNYYRPSVLGTYRNAAPTLAEGRSYTASRINWISENTASYDRTVNDVHHVSALLGYTVQKERVETSYMTATNFPNDEVRTLNAGQVTAGSSTIEEWALLSYLSRVSYDYKGVYLLGASLRRDGSSRFGKNSQWGLFPALSAGWNIGKAAFFPQTAIVEDLKARASYGRTGNNLIPNYGSMALLATSNYVLDGKVVNGLSPSTSPNESLSWEKTDMINAGVDVGLWDGRIFASLDFYNAVTKDLLLNVPVPSSAGYPYSLQNIGKVRNRGIELAVKTSFMLGPVVWKSSVNFSMNRNTVLALGPDQDRILQTYHVTEVGKPIGSYFGYRVAGVFESQQALESYPHLSTSEVGSYRYEDVNGDGKISEDDRTIIGDFFPDYTFGISSGFTFRNIDLSFLLQGSQGVQIYNLSRAFIASTQGWGNSTQAVYDNYFQSTTMPGGGVSKPFTKPTDKLHELSDYMVEDGSFVRVRSITLGYTVPRSMLPGKVFKEVHVYVSARNPFTFTKYKGYNPEVSSWNVDPTTPGIDYGAYPVEKTYVAGVSVNF